MTKKRILIVDDETDCVEFVKAILEDDNTEIISALDGEAGLKIAAGQKPDLVILDVQMPKKDGFKVFTELRQEEATKGIPVVMLTGVGQKTGIKFSKSDMGDFLGEEPEGYVEKPVDPETLKKTVAQVLGG
ncbi:response regulator [Verrucomicrobiota bacterium]